MSRFVLKCKGLLFEGFSEGFVFLTSNAICGSFQLRYVGDIREQKIPFSKDDEIEIYIDSKLIMTAIVEIFSGKISKYEISFTISGRSKARSLFSDLSPREFINLDRSTIAKKIIESCGLICSILKPDTTKIKSFSINPGESARVTLERLTRDSNMILVNNERGEVEITVVSKDAPIVDLTQEDNIKELDFHFSSVETFKEYVVYGQNDLGSNDIYAEVSNLNNQHSRRKIVLSENASSISLAKKRAEREMAFDEKKSKKLKPLVLDWIINKELGLWTPNKNINLKYPALGIKGTFLVSGVKYIQPKGHAPRTQLELEKANSF